MSAPGPTTRPAASSIVGVLARFAGPVEVLTATRRMRGAGYSRLDAYSPFPIHGMDDALGTRRSVLPWIVLVAALAGAGCAWGLQWYTSAVDYPLIIGGKPLHSREAWVPITFEIAVLFAGFATVLGMLALNHLPRFHHPVFQVPVFARVMADGFFLSVEASDPLFDARQTVALLESIGGLDVTLLED